MEDGMLIKQQDDLQVEANEVIHELALDTMLATVGKPVRVGSSALGLMVWRDIDITVVCPKLDLDSVSNLASQLIVRRGVRDLRFRNDAGSFKLDAQYPDGLYIGLSYRSLIGQDWKLDIWFVDEPDKQPDLQHLETMPSRLTPELRESILNIKSFWAGREEYGRTVRSYDIYSAVLEHNVRTPNQFEAWLIKRG